MGHADEVSALCSAIAAERHQRREGLRLLRSSTVVLRRQIGDEMKNSASTRNAASLALVRQLGRERSELAGQMTTMITRFRTGRYQSCAASRQARRGFRTQQRQSTTEFLSTCARERKRETQSTAHALLQQATERRRETAAVLSAHKKERAGYASELGKEMRGWHLGLRRFREGVLSEYQRERSLALASWAGLYREAPVRVEVGSTEAVDQSVEQRVLDTIAANPSGITLVDIEGQLGIPRVRLGVITRRLLEDHLLTKEGRLYLPASRPAEEGTAL